MREDAQTCSAMDVLLTAMAFLVNCKHCLSAGINVTSDMFTLRKKSQVLTRDMQTHKTTEPQGSLEVPHTKLRTRTWVGGGKKLDKKEQLDAMVKILYSTACWIT